MSDELPNPYESPIGIEQPAPPPPFRWRVIPAMLCFCFGALFVVGAMVGTWTVGAVRFGERPAIPLLDLIGLTVMYWAVGIDLLIAAWSYWRGRWRLAIMTTVAGIGLPLFVSSVIIG